MRIKTHPQLKIYRPPANDAQLWPDSEMVACESCACEIADDESRWCGVCGADPLCEMCADTDYHDCDPDAGVLDDRGQASIE